ncbi:MAG: hypothetical protein ACI80V_001947 [Rhodothermales bacterium]|jgi:hypothetical protein
MLRVLFIILAVVSMALAFVLKISWLYLVSALMLIAAAIILTLDTRKRLSRSAVAGSRAASVPQAAPPRDELKALGIMEIRPVAAGSSRTATGAQVGLALEGNTPVADQKKLADTTGSTLLATKTQDSGNPHKPMTEAPGEPKESGIGSPTAMDASSFQTGSSRLGVVRKRVRTPKIMVEGVADHLRGDVILSTLRALRSAVDATSVTLLKQERDPVGYTVEAIISQNSFARSGGRFGVAELFLNAGGAQEPVVLRCNGSEGFNARRLGYYHEPIAIHKVAFVPLNRGGAAYLLVADSMSDHAFGDADALRMLREFGRLVGVLISDPDTDVGAAEESSLRPRREIIAEEMSAARGASRPLALALVYLNRANALVENDRPSAESALESRLHAESGGGRVERFGELTYGILKTDTADHVADWASGLQARFNLETDQLRGGISIGIAMLADRHRGADSLRADATTALRESYETGECIILE